EGQLPVGPAAAQPIAHAVGDGAAATVPGAQLREAALAKVPQGGAQGLKPGLRGLRGLRGHRHLRERGRTCISYEAPCTSVPGRSGAVRSQGQDEAPETTPPRSEEHTSELQSRFDLVCRLLLENKKHKSNTT